MRPVHTVTHSLFSMHYTVPVLLVSAARNFRIQPTHNRLDSLILRGQDKESSRHT